MLWKELDVLHHEAGHAGTHIGNAALGQLAIPLVLNFADLVTVREDVDLALDNFFRSESLDLVSRLQIHHNGVACIRDLVTESLNLREGCLETVPLRFEFLAPGGSGDRVDELPIVFPELQFGE